MISKKRAVLLIVYFWIGLGLVFYPGGVLGARVAGQEDVTSTVNKPRPADQQKAAPAEPQGRLSGQEQGAPAGKERIEPERKGPAPVRSGRAEKPSKETRYVTIDFDDVDISLFIKFISELTGKNFIIDKAVRGNVTIISPTKIAVDDAYKVFESVLEIYGFTAIPAGNVVKIVPALDARSKDIETRIRKEVKNPQDKIVTQLISLKYADPDEIKKIFGPFVSKSSVIVSYPPTGMLIITDVLSNIQRLLKIIEVIDVEGIGEELTVIQLEHATASVLAGSLGTIFQQTRSAARGQAKTESVIESAVKIIPDERTNALILLASENDTSKIKALIKLLDRETPRGEGDIHVYYLQNSNAEDLTQVLMAIPSSETQEAGKGKAPVVSKEVQIVADKATNSLVITAKKADYIILEDIIKKLDISRPMVYIEALIMEVSLKKDFNIGVEWQAMDQVGSIDHKGNELAVGVFGGSRPAGSVSLPSTDTSTGLALLPSGFTLGVLGEAISIAGVQFPTIAAVINAYQNDSDVNILSTPQIMTIDNEEAEIVVAENIPFLTQISTTTAGQPIENFEYKDVGVTLNITPQINHERFVRLKISQEVSEVLNQLDNRPSTLKRQAKTTVVVKDGNTIVIGGLIDETLNRSKSQVPCLGSLTGIGALFSTTSNSSNRTNLYIFLTPHIIENAKEAEKVYQKKKAQIEWEKEASVKLYEGRGRYREDMRLNDKGYGYLLSGDYEKAEGYFEKALKVNPDNPYAILNMGVLYEKQGRKEEAIKMYEKIIQLNPEDRAGESTNVMKIGDSLVDIARDNLLKLKGNGAR